MDELLLEEFESALHRLVRHAPALDDLLVPRQASSGENAGKPPTRGESKLPLNAVFLDLKLQTFEVVNDCCRWLRNARPEVGALPSPRDIVDCCEWLQFHLEELASQPWATRSAEMVIAQSMLVGDVVSPPPSLTSPTPVEVGTVPIVTRWAQWLGRKVSQATVYRWVEAGKIPADYRPDGTLLIKLPDVLSAVDSR